MQRRAPLRVIVRSAVRSEASYLFDLVNRAYSVEKGSTGLAFKAVDRYLSVVEVEEDIAEAAASSAAGGRFLVAVEPTEPTEPPGLPLGCVNVRVSELGGRRIVGYGPFAVDPAAQGSGVGSALLGAVDAIAVELNSAAVDIEVVNHREDLLGFYGRRGYVAVKTAPCDAAHNCDESQITRPSHFVCLTKRLKVVGAARPQSAALSNVGSTASEQQPRGGGRKPYGLATFSLVVAVVFLAIAVVIGVTMGGSGGGSP